MHPIPCQFSFLLIIQLYPCHGEAYEVLLWYAASSHPPSPMGFFLSQKSFSKTDGVSRSVQSYLAGHYSNNFLPSADATSTEIQGSWCADAKSLAASCILHSFRRAFMKIRVLPFSSNCPPPRHDLPVQVNRFALWSITPLYTINTII